MIADFYAQKVTAGLLSADRAQANLVPALASLQQEIVARADHRPSILGQIFTKPPQVPKGFYIWGGVGRGKSMMMDLFFESLPISKKKRVHFHAFMQSIHHAMHEVRKSGVDDALTPVAAALAKDLNLLALDEMQILDITDAMIVGRLFEYLVKAGVVVMTTSNRPPDALYQDGLNRALFLPFIAYLQENLRLVHMQGAKDYRQEKLAGTKLYFLASQKAKAEIDVLWRDLTAGTDCSPLNLLVNGRAFQLPLFASGMARTDFASLCAQAYGPADYLAVAQALRLLILEDVPQLSKDNHNEAKRFVTLIDALYEANTRLSMSAATLPDQLYKAGRGAFEFERTASRLHEMQSATWGLVSG
jgi:cell division protein ZapE